MSREKKESVKGKASFVLELFGANLDFAFVEKVIAVIFFCFKWLWFIILKNTWKVCFGEGFGAKLTVIIFFIKNLY